MYIEIHILQNFAPSNLNRSDTGAPKDCEFGGVRRARISSQCLKRAMRDAFNNGLLIKSSNGEGEARSRAFKDNLAVRTKRLVDEIARQIVPDASVNEEAGNTQLEEAKRVVEAALNGVKLTVKENSKTQYLLFLGKDEIKRIAELCKVNYAELLAVTGGSVNVDAPTGKKVSAKDAKKAAKDAVPKDLQKKLEEVLDGGKAADLALFGRMLADLPGKNVDAASQVAHAISTNKTGIEFDFYTAVDDLRPGDTEGADMLGTIEFNSACFYRYANVNFKHLSETNLAGDAELARDTIEAFIRAAVLAVPTGKQNSMAAQNPPSFVLAVARNSGLWSLANAFVKPVRPDGKNDLVEKSITQLGDYWGQLSTMYGDGEIVDCCYVNLQGRDVEGFATGKKNQKRRADSVDELVERMRGALSDERDANGEGGAR